MSKETRRIQSSDCIVVDAALLVWKHSSLENLDYASLLSPPAVAARLRRPAVPVGLLSRSAHARCKFSSLFARGQAFAYDRAPLHHLMWIPFLSVAALFPGIVADQLYAANRATLLVATKDANNLSLDHLATRNARSRKCNCVLRARRMSWQD